MHLTSSQLLEMALKILDPVEAVVRFQDLLSGEGSCRNGGSFVALKRFHVLTLSWAKPIIAVPCSAILRVAGKRTTYATMTRKQRFL